MKRTNIQNNSSHGKKGSVNALQMRMQALTTTLSRVLLASTLGYQYGTDRNLYQALGYPTLLEEITFENCLARFRRQDLARGIIERPVKVTWRGKFDILESKDDKDTALEKEWKAMVKRLKLKSVFNRSDILTGLGKYSVLVLGLSDVKADIDFKEPVRKGLGLKLLYVKPVGECNAQIKTWENDPGSSRFGLPRTYDIALLEPEGTRAKTIEVHHSRIMHILDNELESEVEGRPRLEVIWNRLMDLEKVVGGAAEMFWRGARGGYHGKIDKGFERTKEMDDDLEGQLDEYEHNLRRFLITEGIDVESLQQQLSDPKNHVDVIIQMISVVTQIPKRILTGSERGELSSSQDHDEYTGYIQQRREEFAENKILRPFIERLIEYRVLPAATTEEWSIDWSDLFAKGEKELAEIGKIRASALKEYAANPNDLPFRAFLQYMLGLKEEQINQVEEMIDAEINNEEPMSEEETNIIQEEQSRFTRTRQTA